MEIIWIRSHHMCFLEGGPQASMIISPSTPPPCSSSPTTLLTRRYSVHQCSLHHQGKEPLLCISFLCCHKWSQCRCPPYECPLPISLQTDTVPMPKEVHSDTSPFSLTVKSLTAHSPAGQQRHTITGLEDSIPMCALHTDNPLATYTANRLQISLLPSSSSRPIICEV